MSRKPKLPPAMNLDKFTISAAVSMSKGFIDGFLHSLNPDTREAKLNYLFKVRDYINDLIKRERKLE